MNEAVNANTRVLIVTGDVIGTKMAGPAIRSFEMAKVLSKTCDVHLVSTKKTSLSSTNFQILGLNENELREQVDWCEVLIFQGNLLSTHPWIRSKKRILVADIYDPMHLEFLEQGKNLSPKAHKKQETFIHEVLNIQLELADFFLCSSEKQRDFWLGQLAGVGRINTSTYNHDASLRSLIDVVPFGVAQEPPSQTRHAIKGAIDGIGEDDKVIIWGGGIYNWFDPLTAIRAVEILRESHPNLRLFFLGAKHPNPDVPEMKVAHQAMKLADELELTNKHVFFNTDWVDYDDRVNFLLDSDIGISTHFEHVETSFSFRTRILDYLWAGLPIVATEGDVFAEIIQAHSLGRVVPYEDAQALAAAINDLLSDPHISETHSRVSGFGQNMVWANALQPLVNFCNHPQQAADAKERRDLPAKTHFQRSISLLRHTTFWRHTENMRAFLLRMKRSKL